MKMSTNFNKCEDKAWCWSCDECQSKPYLCFICNEAIPHRDSHSHISKHYNDPNQYLTWRMCKISKHISYYRYRMKYVLDVDYVSISVDKDLVILKKDLEIYLRYI